MGGEAGAPVRLTSASGGQMLLVKIPLLHSSRVPLPSAARFWWWWSSPARLAQTPFPSGALQEAFLVWATRLPLALMVGSGNSERFPRGSSEFQTHCCLPPSGSCLSPREWGAVPQAVRVRRLCLLVHWHEASPAARWPLSLQATGTPVSVCGAHLPQEQIRPGTPAGPQILRRTSGWRRGRDRPRVACFLQLCVVGKAMV